MSERKAQPRPPLLEWVVGGAGAVLFFAILAVLIVTGLQDASRPPSIHVDIARVSAIEGGYVLEFIARNESETTAADVAIVAELQAGADVQQGEARFDYLPPRSARRGGFFFESDPRQGALELRAEAYNEP